MRQDKRRASPHACDGLRPADARAGMRAQEEAGPPKGSTTCLYCRAPCDADLFAREPVWACAGCGEAAAHVTCFHAAHAVPHDGDGFVRQGRVTCFHAAHAGPCGGDGCVHQVASRP